MAKESQLKTEYKKTPGYVAAGIALSASVGRDLAYRFPEIADEWRALKSLEKIADEYCPDNLTAKVAVNSIYYAVRELITDKKELKELTRQHALLYSKIRGSKGGTTTYKRGKGCFGISTEARHEASHKGGKIAGAISGRKNYDAGIGIASITREELIEIGKKAARNRGQVPYDERILETSYGNLNERDYIIHLKEDTNLSWREITEQLNFTLKSNNQSHTRNLESIRTMYNARFKNRNLPNAG